MRPPLLALFLLLLLATPACQTTPSPKEREHPSTHLSQGDAQSPLHYWLHRAAHSTKPNQQHRATTKILEHWRKNPNASTGPYQLTISSPKKDRIDPLFFDEYLRADSCNTRSLNTRHTRQGIGTPLVGRKKYSPNHPLHKYQPENGIERAITAHLTFSSPHQATLTLYDPDKTPELNGQPLAADFSAPISNAIGNIRLLRRQGIFGLFRSGDPNLAPGFLFAQPYDPDKIPLILVHGLLSSQAAWRNVANDLTANPNIRQRYQIWFYHYPTGNPVLVSSQAFRRNLNQLRSDLNPSLRDPAMQKSIVIAHSMGGILSKTLITSSGDKLWKGTFTVSQHDLPNSITQKQLLLDTFHWKPRPEIHRVIYVAVPHRGSKMANNIIGRLAQHLIRLPQTLVNITSELINLDSSTLTDEAALAFQTLSLNSVRNLSLNDPTLISLSQLPVAPWVHQHSIIGKHNPRTPLLKSSDGVVPYTSSHLPNAESELIVPSHHGAYKKPQTVQEIIRILHLP